LISLYTGISPAGYKVTIMLEECGLPYKPLFPDLTAREHKQPPFLAMNPNGRIPVIIDHDAGDLTVWESSAIQIYLAEKTGRFLPTDPIKRIAVLQWLVWQTAGLGPMQAQLNVFRHLFPEKLPSVIGRYERETYRLYSVMEKQLGERRYIACESYTIADMACWPWVASADWSRLSLDRYPNVRRWLEEVGARSAVQAGMTVPPAGIPPEDGGEDYERIVSLVRGNLS
jgi:GSH-dependent disulfide-bond oxidoreductase